MLYLNNDNSVANLYLYPYLTLTSVVFEYNILNIFEQINLTLTSVVFESSNMVGL